MEGEFDETQGGWQGPAVFRFTQFYMIADSSNPLIFIDFKQGELVSPRNKGSFYIYPIQREGRYFLNLADKFPDNIRSRGLNLA